MDADQASEPALAERVQKLGPDTISLLRTSVSVTSVVQCVDELLLNALDALSSCIEVRVNLNTYSVCVTDDGVGLDMESLRLVGERYTTSKFDGEKLYNDVGSHDAAINKVLVRPPRHFGFFGEALASLKDISNLDIYTKTSSGPALVKKFADGVVVCCSDSCPPRPSAGTTVQVHRLFYNMPLRQRGQSASALSHIKHGMQRLAIIHPQVTFKLINDINDKTILDTKHYQSPLQAFREIFPTLDATVLSNLHVIQTTGGNEGQFTLEGIMSTTGYFNKSYQFLYLNKRLLRKTDLHKHVNGILKNSVISGLHTIAAERPSGLYSRPPIAKAEKHGVFALNLVTSAPHDICIQHDKSLVEFKDWDAVFGFLDEAIGAFLSKYKLLLGPAQERDAPENSRGKSLDASNSMPLSSKVHEYHGSYLRSAPIKRKITELSAKTPLKRHFSSPVRSQYGSPVTDLSNAFTPRKTPRTPGRNKQQSRVRADTPGSAKVSDKLRNKLASMGYSPRSLSATVSAPLHKPPACTVATDLFASPAKHFRGPTSECESSSFAFASSFAPSTPTKRKSDAHGLAQAIFTAANDAMGLDGSKLQSVGKTYRVSGIVSTMLPNESPRAVPTKHCTKRGDTTSTTPVTPANRRLTKCVQKNYTKTSAGTCADPVRSSTTLASMYGTNKTMPNLARFNGDIPNHSDTGAILKHQALYPTPQPGAGSGGLVRRRASGQVISLSQQQSETALPVSSDNTSLSDHASQQSKYKYDALSAQPRSHSVSHSGHQYQESPPITPTRVSNPLSCARFSTRLPSQSELGTAPVCQFQLQSLPFLQGVARRSAGVRVDTDAAASVSQRQKIHTYRENKQQPGRKSSQSSLGLLLAVPPGSQERVPIELRPSVTKFQALEQDDTRTSFEMHTNRSPSQASVAAEVASGLQSSRVQKKTRDETPNNSATSALPCENTATPHASLSATAAPKRMSVMNLAPTPKDRFQSNHADEITDHTSTQKSNSVHEAAHAAVHVCPTTKETPDAVLSHELPKSDLCAADQSPLSETADAVTLANSASDSQQLQEIAPSVSTGHCLLTTDKAKYPSTCTVGSVRNPDSAVNQSVLSEKSGQGSDNHASHRERLVNRGYASQNIDELSGIIRKSASTSSISGVNTSHSIHPRAEDKRKPQEHGGCEHEAHTPAVRVSSQPSTELNVTEILAEWENPVLRPVPQQLRCYSASSYVKYLKDAEKTSTAPVLFTRDMLNKARVLSQVDRSYIVCLLPHGGNAVDNPVVALVDQHAAHERLRLEEILAEFSEDQQCNVKAVPIDPFIAITATEDDALCVQQHRQVLSRWGIEVIIDLDASLDERIIVSSLPEVFKLGVREDDLEHVVRTLVNEQIHAHQTTGGMGTILPRVMKRVFNHVACRGAIKFGDDLSIDVCRRMITDLAKCAHGRPTVIPLADLEQVEKYKPVANRQTQA